MMHTNHSRRGFSLVEIVTALTILAVIGVALTKLVVGQTRSFQFENSGRRARTASRSAMNIMITDLRMTQDMNGVDSVDALTHKWVDVKVPVAFGVVCSVSGGSITAALVAVDSFQLATTKYGGYATRATTGAYTYTPATSSSAMGGGTISNCRTPGIYADTAVIAGRSGKIVRLSPAPAVAPAAGDPMFIWQHVRYEFAASQIYSNRIGLWRKVSGNLYTDVTSEEIMAPFSSTARFSYFVTPGTNYHDTASTVAPASLNTIRGFQIYLPAESADTVAGHTAPQRSVTTTAVFFKNTRIQ